MKEFEWWAPSLKCFLLKAQDWRALDKILHAMDKAEEEGFVCITTPEATRASFCRNFLQSFAAMLALIRLTSTTGQLARGYHLDWLGCYVRIVIGVCFDTQNYVRRRNFHVHLLLPPQRVVRFALHIRHQL